MHLDVCYVQCRGLPVLGQLARGIDCGFDKVISKLQQELFNFLIQLLVGVHLSNQILQPGPGEHLNWKSNLKSWAGRNHLVLPHLIISTSPNSTGRVLIPCVRRRRVGWARVVATLRWHFFSLDNRPDWNRQHKLLGTKLAAYGNVQDLTNFTRTFLFVYLFIIISSCF